MSGGSLQLRQYRVARRAGMPVEEAAALADFTLTEAKMTDADDAAGSAASRSIRAAWRHALRDMRTGAVHLS
ncbi:hypothetical protein AB5I41_31635 [Sphingomonas sp. MMS24-JH45]